jgi:hypothetical protein
MVVLCLLIAACDQVYGLTGRTDDARPSDGEIGDGPPDASCPVPLVLDPGTVTPVNAMLGSEAEPSLAADHLELYFTRTLSGSDVFRATRANRQAPWSVGAPLALNTAYDDADPSITADGLRLFFTSNRETMSGFRAAYEAKRSSPGAEWATVEKINATTFSVESLDVSADGLRLYVVEAGVPNVHVLQRGSIDDPFLDPQAIGLGLYAPSIDAGDETIYWEDTNKQDDDGIRVAHKNGSVFLGADLLLVNGLDPDLSHDGSVLMFQQSGGGLAYIEATCPGR